MSGSGQDTMVSSQVEVAVDPDTAFAAFTEELDLWWERGPINHFADLWTGSVLLLAEQDVRGVLGVGVLADGGDLAVADGPGQAGARRG